MAGVFDGVRKFFETRREAKEELNLTSSELGLTGITRDINERADEEFVENTEKNINLAEMTLNNPEKILARSLAMQEAQRQRINQEIMAQQGAFPGMQFSLDSLAKQQEKIERFGEDLKLEVESHMQSSVQMIQDATGKMQFVAAQAVGLRENPPVDKEIQAEKLRGLVGEYKEAMDTTRDYTHEFNRICNERVDIDKQIAFQALSHVAQNLNDWQMAVLPRQTSEPSAFTLFCNKTFNPAQYIAVMQDDRKGLDIQVGNNSMFMQPGMQIPLDRIDYTLEMYNRPTGIMTEETIQKTKKDVVDDLLGKLSYERQDITLDVVYGMGKAIKETELTEDKIQDTLREIIANKGDRARYVLNTADQVNEVDHVTYNNVLNTLSQAAQALAMHNPPIIVTDIDLRQDCRMEMNGLLAHPVNHLYLRTEEGINIRIDIDSRQQQPLGIAAEYDPKNGLDTVEKPDAEGNIERPLAQRYELSQFTSAYQFEQQLDACIVAAADIALEESKDAREHTVEKDQDDYEKV